MHREAKSMMKKKSKSKWWPVRVGSNRDRKLDLKFDEKGQIQKTDLFDFEKCAVQITEPRSWMFGTSGWVSVRNEEWN